MKNLKTITAQSLYRLCLPATVAVALGASSCAPLLDPNHPNQAPDINYEVTATKDAQFVGNIAAIDNIVQARIGTKFPGAAIAVVCGDRIVYMNGYGLADADDHVLFTKNTVAGIGSVSKVLTAIGVMKLVEMGEVNLDASIDTYFPHAVPAGWDDVTVRELLSHRGGFERDPDSSLAGARTPADVDEVFGEEKASQHPRRAIWEFKDTTQGTPAPNPAKTYSYSNLGYTILGAIIDNVTQANSFGAYQGYERFTWSLVAGADDAALTAVLNHPWRDDDIPNLAKSYTANWNAYSPNWSGWQGPPGGWSMTIGDLARIAIALNENQILQPSSLEEMQTNHAGADWYGLGLQVQFKSDKVAYSHAGAIDGFRTQFTVWPEREVAVVGFINAGEMMDGNAVVDLEGEINDIVNEIGDLWIYWKENFQTVPVHFVEEDRDRMNTAVFQVSQQHFGKAERTVQALIRGESGDANAALRLLETELERQGGKGRALLDLSQGNSRDAESIATQFLALLDDEKHVGPFKPDLHKSTLGSDLKGRWAYAENGAWLDGHWDTGAPDGGKGVKVSEHILAGQAYAGNLGWISLGDGSPEDGIRYTNLGEDFGVNVDLSTGQVRGQGYGCNIGWVLFEEKGNPRLDVQSGCFLGYAYSANCGWINLAPKRGEIGWKTVSLDSGPDRDGDGLPDPWELEQAGDLTTLTGWGDHDLDGVSDEQEHVAGTDPTDAQSHLLLWVEKSPGGVLVAWTSQASRIYTLFSTGDLQTWGKVPEVVGVPGDPAGTMGYEMSGLEGTPRRFWRVEATLPFGP